jgi:hypothetical protein
MLTWRLTFRRAMTSVHSLSCSLYGEESSAIKDSEVTSRHLTLHEASRRYAVQKYEEFIKEGSLHVLEGTVLDMMEVYDDLDNVHRFRR